MKCGCGHNITHYRTIGALLAYDDLDELKSRLFNLRLGSLFKTMAMVECRKCGKIEFYSQESDYLSGMQKELNAPLSVEFNETQNKR